MRCQAFITISPKARRARFVAHPGPTVYGERMSQPEGTEVCGGELTVTVRAGLSPYCVCSPALEIEVKCGRCHNLFHGDPPPIPEDESGLSDYLTRLVRQA
jgi:hypothetical protein